MHDTVSLTVINCLTLCLQATEISSASPAKDTYYGIQSHGLKRDQGMQVDVVCIDQTCQNFWF